MTRYNKNDDGEWVIGCESCDIPFDPFDDVILVRWGNTDEQR